MRVEDARPIQEWIDDHGSQQSGPSSVIVAGVSCNDGYDDGVIDSWGIELTGYPLEPIPDEDVVGGFQQL
jgi:hypothetical protein